MHDVYHIVQKIAKERGVSFEALGNRLFPRSKDPRRTFSRMIHCRKKLTVEHLFQLADMLHCDPAEFFDPSRWRAMSITNESMFYIGNNSFYMKLNSKTWEGDLYVNEELIEKNVVLSGTVTLDDLLSYINDKMQDWIDIS